MGQTGQEATDPFLHLGHASQEHIASGFLSNPAPDRLSALKSGHSPAGSPAEDPNRVCSSTPEQPRHDGSARCPKSPSAAQSAFPATDSGKRPRFRCCRFLQFHPPHLSCLQAHRRIVAALLGVAGAGRVHQRRFPFQRPLAPQLDVRPEVGLTGKEYLGSGPLGLLQQRGIQSATKASRLASFALTAASWGRLRTNPKRGRFCTV